MAVLPLNDGYFAIIDVEATCSVADRIVVGEMEVIEIGAAVVDAESLRLERSFESYVRPSRIGAVTKFCTELTGIKQTDLVSAPCFREVFGDLVSWMGIAPPSVMVSWSTFDWKIIRKECDVHRITFPFASHFDIKAWFAQVMSLPEPVKLAEAVEISGLDWEGRPHRGLDDVKNIVCVLRRHATTLM